MPEGGDPRESAAGSDEPKGRKLSEDDLSDLHERAVKAFDEWWRGSEAGRAEAAQNEQYYHGSQWTADQVKTLRARGQEPVVINRIQKKINYLVGAEIAERADPKALPRTPKHDDDATPLTDALRYVVEKEKFDRTATVAYKDGLVAGWYGALVEAIPSKTNDDERDLVIRPVRWNRIFWDIASTAHNFNDARYKGIFRWMDKKAAKGWYANHPYAADDVESVIESSMDQFDDADDSTGDRPQDAWLDRERGRFRVIERWWLDVDDDGNEIWMVEHYTRNGFLVRPRPSDYLDDNDQPTCNLVIASTYIDQDNDRYGLVRSMMWPQQELNHHRSKGLYAASTRSVVYESDVFTDPHKALEALARPAHMVEVQRDALTQGRLNIQAGTDMQQSQFAMMEMARQEIDQTGPDLPQIGNIGGDASGVALDLRKKIGQLEVAEARDVFLAWKLEIYVKTYHCIRQYKTAEWWMRVSDDTDQKGYRFVSLNKKTTRAERYQQMISDGVPPPMAMQMIGIDMAIPQAIMAGVQQQAQALAQRTGQPPPPEALQQLAQQTLMQHPAMQEVMTVNDVAQMDMDIVLTETPTSVSLQQEEYRELTQLMLPMAAQSQDPKITPSLILRMAIEASSLGSKQKLLKTLEQPDQTPEQAQQQQMAMQMAQAKAAADIDRTKAQTELDRARAKKALVDARIAPEKAAVDAEDKQSQANKRTIEALAQMDEAEAAGIPQT